MMGKRWRCFHCDEVFTMWSTARAHFGQHELQDPMCLVDPEEFRRMERELEAYRAEDSAKDRQMAAMAADHAQALRREEEAGYGRGVADMRAEVSVLQNALSALVDRYVAKAYDNNQMWRWDPETDEEVIHARTVLEATGFQRREIKTDA